MPKIVKNCAGSSKLCKKVQKNEKNTGYSTMWAETAQSAEMFGNSYKCDFVPTSCI